MDIAFMIGLANLTMFIVGIVVGATIERRLNKKPAGG